MRSELSRRVAVAAVGIPFALAVLYLGGWPLALVLAGIAAAAATELYRLARQRGARPFTASGAILAAVPVLLALALEAPGDAAAWSWRVFLAASLIATAVAIFRRGVEGAPLAAAAVTVFGALLTGGSLAHALYLRQMPVAVFAAGADRWVGPALLLFPLILTWLSDTTAYFGGRRFGRHKLIPVVSPGKTVEGAVAGVLGTVVTGAVYAHFVFDAWLGLPLGAALGAGIGLIVSPVAQLGDLAESLLKREAGVKDSGTLLPGHGGVLDRFDSLFFTIPTTYWLLAIVLHVGAG
ncbi:MAG: phosphatidate cytidylyltransferase [Gemmatimonadota bacterium]